MMDFDTKCADLALQGWQPVKSIGCDGLYNPDIGFGIGLCVREDNPACMVGTIYTLSNKTNALTPVDWGDISEYVVTRIEYRLRQT
jgi:hypothetical protein